MHARGLAPALGWGRRKKARELLGHDVFKGVRRVKLQETRSAFWRFHTKGVADEGVCTAEALLFFLQALATEVRMQAAGVGVEDGVEEAVGGGVRWRCVNAGSCSHGERRRGGGARAWSVQGMRHWRHKRGCTGFRGEPSGPDRDDAFCSLRSVVRRWGRGGMRRGVGM